MKWRIFLTLFLVIGLFWWGAIFFQTRLENFFYAQISQPLQDISLVKIPERQKKSNLEISAKSAISIKISEVNGEKVFFQKNSDKPLPIASLTKLMTALIILEDEINYEFSKIVTVSKEAISQYEDFGNLKIEDKLSVKNLFHIMLIESSNDAAYAFAEKIGVKEFVERMNQKAKTLNLENTYFINPHGLDPKDGEAPGNFSTAQDLVKLTKYILRYHPIIFEISLKMSYEILDSNGQFHHLAVNKNEFLTEIPNIIGIKTGFTEEAGYCMLVIFGDKNSYGINAILNTESPETRLEEMQKLIGWLKI